MCNAVSANISFMFSEKLISNFIMALLPLKTVVFVFLFYSHIKHLLVHIQLLVISFFSPHLFVKENCSEFPQWGRPLIFLDSVLRALTPPLSTTHLLYVSFLLAVSPHWVLDITINESFFCAWEGSLFPQPMTMRWTPSFITGSKNIRIALLPT